jgi:RNA polymerase sigma-70 factor (ECF subfamily)
MPNIRINEGGDPGPQFGFSLADWAAEFALVRIVLKDADRAYDILAAALAQLPYTQRALFDNRRPRRRGETPREPYRTLCGNRELLRILVLDGLDMYYQRAEHASWDFDADALLLRYVLRLVIEVITRNSFYASVAMGQILTKTPSPTLLALFDGVAADRSTPKDASACTTAKQRIVKGLIARFRGRLRTKGDAALELVPGDRHDAETVADALKLFLPEVPMRIQVDTAGSAASSAFNVPLEDVSATDLSIMRQFLIADNFLKLLKTLSSDSAAETFDSRLMIPIFDNGDDIPPGDGRPIERPPIEEFAMDRLVQAANRLSRRRSRMAPGSLRLNIGRTETLLPYGKKASLESTADASIVRIVADDSHGEPLIVATYILGGDEHEHWSVAVSDEVSLSLEFNRGDNDDCITVFATWQETASIARSRALRFNHPELESVVGVHGDAGEERHSSVQLLEVGEITRLLGRASRGDQEALSKLMPLVYQDLQRIAHARILREHDHSVQATELVHEVYLRLVRQRFGWKNREQFYAVAAQLMRRLLIDRARKRLAEKRGGLRQRVPLNDDAIGLALAPDVAIERVAQALDRLAVEHPRASRVVELRYFLGLTIEETAEVLGLSTESVKRDWRVARALLAQQIGQ